MCRQILIDCSSPILELTLANENTPVSEAPIFITGFEITDSEVCSGPNTIVGTEIKPEGSCKICICQHPWQPPVATGIVTLSALANGHEIIAKIKWVFTGESFPTDSLLEAEDVLSPWIVKVPEVPPHGGMGSVTVRFMKGLE